MIENMTEKEIHSLVEELKASGYIGKNGDKKLAIIKDEAKKLGMVNFGYNELHKPLYEIADIVTNNFTEKGETRRKCRNGIVAKDIEPKYREIVSGVLKVVKPYYKPYSSHPRFSIEPEED